MFETVLVADRGATARRVVRTCQRLGARTVVVHDDDDGGAPAVRAADEAVPLGGSGWAQSYGDPRRVLEAAKRSGAEAVHPGAGWLAQDAALARAVLDEGLVWLGISPEALDRTQEQTAELVGSLGLSPAAATGRRLVATTFHDGGRVRLLGLREQLRRDGAPLADVAPAELSEAVRGRCEHAALVVAGAAQAGPLAAIGLTVAGEDVGVVAVLPPLLPGFSATEVESGLDLVELQLLCAAGERPPDAVRGRHGLALHLRVADRYAGRLRRWSVPPDDDAFQVDAGVRKGDRVQVGSDRTLAVLTVEAPDRAAVLARARTALSGVVVEGVPTTLAALGALLDELSSPGGNPP